VKIKLSAPARADLLAHTDWLMERSPAAASAAVEAILEVVDLLSDFPRLGIELDDGTREKGVRFGRYGYIIRYEITADALVVRRIFHGRQDR
jgi:plasmid stabilization system protein ParE